MDLFLLLCTLHFSYCTLLPPHNIIGLCQYICAFYVMYDDVEIFKCFKLHIWSLGKRNFDPLCNCQLHCVIDNKVY